jgi:hypothetical protein
MKLPHVNKFLMIGIWCLVVGGWWSVVSGQWSVRLVFAEDSIEALQKQINDLQHLKELSESATKPLEKEVASIAPG